MTALQAMTASEALNWSQEDRYLSIEQVVRMCTQILQYLHLHRLSITMHSQLLLWKCRDVHGYGAAGSPLSAPSISTGCGLAFLPPLTFICWQFGLPLTQGEWGAGLALGLHGWLPLTVLGLGKLLWVGAADSEVFGLVCMEVCLNGQPAFAPCLWSLCQAYGL